MKCFIWGTVCLGVLFLFGCSGYMKAEFKRVQKNYDEAIPLYKEYLGNKPDSARARSKLGFVYFKTGQLDKAIVEFNQALELKPGDPYSVYYLGLVYLNQEDFDKAIRTWKGYKNKKEPLVEEEIKRQLTLLEIAASQRAAKKALAEEKKLATLQPDKKTIAVCYFKDLSPDKSLRALQKGLTAMIISDLAKIKSIKVVERVRLQALLEEMKLGQTGIVDQSTAPKVGRLLGAENMVVGTLRAGSIELTGSVASSTTGRVLGTISAVVPLEEFYRISGIVVQNLARIQGIELTADEIKSISIPHTKVFKAFVYFGEALDALDAGNWKRARDLFVLALQADPKFDLARKGKNSCPRASSPPKKLLAKLSVADISSQISNAVKEAKKEAKKARARAKSISKGKGSTIHRSCSHLLP